MDRTSLGALRSDRGGLIDNDGSGRVRLIGVAEVAPELLPPNYLEAAEARRGNAGKHTAFFGAKR